jgi:hypothetical protein
MAGTYLELEPPPDLRPWLRCVWTYDSNRGDPGVQRIAPDGCAELILHFAAPYEEQGEDGRFRPQPRAVFAGQLTRPLLLRSAGPVRTVGARFHPWAAKAWLGQPMASVTDLRIDVTQALGPAALPAATPEAVQLAVEERIATLGVVLDPHVRAEVERIESGRGERPDISPRALQRAFLDQVGISPRALRSVVRLRTVFDRAAMDDGPQWLTGALAAGYFDQPQMARDFRRFLGCTATAWARGQIGLARAIASQTYKTDGPEPG